MAENFRRFSIFVAIRKTTLARALQCSVSQSHSQATCSLGGVASLIAICDNVFCEMPKSEPFVKRSVSNSHCFHQRG